MSREQEKEVVLYLSPDQGAEARRAFASLDKWDLSRSGNHASKREFERRQYRTGVILSLCVTGLLKDAPGLHTIFVVAYGRNISTSGLGFLVDRTLYPIDGVSNDAPALEITQVLSVGSHLSCGLLQPPADTIWLDAEVMRMRNVPDEMFEVGVHFDGRRETSSLPNYDFAQTVADLQM